MRNDPFFKFVAVIIIAGVLLSFVSPKQPAATGSSPTTTAAAQPLPARVVDGAQ
jgi:hypothetical protein